MYMQDSIKKIKLNNGSPYCKECGDKMIVKQSKIGDYFYGCKNFPKCRHSESV
jgi:ssDNA-binding Zn-finger/Zn-ribbon topoisomerase 1